MKKIYFAYSDVAEDLNLYRELKLHFTPYAKKGLLKIIDREEVFAISGSIKKAGEIIHEADIAVPLLSVDYLNNEECLLLLDSAAASNKTVIPVLLRRCDWGEIEKLKQLESKILPEDKEPVKKHIQQDGGDDEVLAGIARKVKAVLFETDLDIFPDQNEGRRPKTFYFLVCGIILAIGALVSSLVHSAMHDWRISVLAFLMFLMIALFAGRKALFAPAVKFR